MDREKWIGQWLDGLDELEYVRIWNEYCEKNNYTEEIVHPMASFNEMFSGLTPLELADIGNSAVTFNVNDNWFVAKESYGWEVTSDDDARYLTEQTELIDYIADNIGFYDLDDADYRRQAKEEFDSESEWEEFEKWFDSEYDCSMCEFDLDELTEEWDEFKKENR